MGVTAAIESRHRRRRDGHPELAAYSAALAARTGDGQAGVVRDHGILPFRGRKPCCEQGFLPQEGNVPRPRRTAGAGEACGATVTNRRCERAGGLGSGLATRIISWHILGQMPQLLAGTSNRGY